VLYSEKQVMQTSIIQNKLCYQYHILSVSLLYLVGKVKSLQTK